MRFRGKRNRKLFLLRLLLLYCSHKTTGITNPKSRKMPSIFLHFRIKLETVNNFPARSLLACGRDSGGLLLP